jgi:putative membrane protein
MAFLSDSERTAIAEAIREAEQRTSGEIVAVVAPASDSYVFIPLLWASMLALLVPLPSLVFDLPLSYLAIYALQLASFLVLALLFRWEPVRMKLIPRAVKNRWAARMARMQFFAQGLHLTAGRTGVLLFVSVAEHYVEVLADAGIDEKVAPGTWDALVGAFVAKVKAGRVGDGFIAAVGTCGALLAEHFPAVPGDRDELPNRLIEL